MATTLLLIRHAVTPTTGRRLGGRTQAPLDDAGRVQAEATATRLADVPLAAIYASPLPRAHQTAEIVAARHNLPVLGCEGLVEVDYGRWTDRPLGSVQRTKLWPVILSRPSLVRFPGGESIRDMQLRAVAAAEELVERHRNRVVAAVSHGDVIKALVAFYLGQPLDLFQRLVVGPASTTVLRLGTGTQPMLLRFNDDGPLTGERFAVSAKRSAQTSRRRGSDRRRSGEGGP